jgi:predicted enzyme related to lactoylglutathione lyase
MPNPVTWFEVHSKNAKSTQDFFKKMFAWKVDDKNPMKYGIVDTGSKAGIQGGIGAAMKGAPSMVTFYVEVKEIGPYLKKAVKFGGKVLMPETTIPDMVTIAMIATPEGHAIGLLKAETMK